MGAEDSPWWERDEPPTAEEAEQLVTAADQRVRSPLLLVSCLGRALRDPNSPPPLSVSNFLCMGVQVSPACPSLIRPNFHP